MAFVNKSVCLEKKDRKQEIPRPPPFWQEPPFTIPEIYHILLWKRHITAQNIPITYFRFLQTIVLFCSYCFTIMIFGTLLLCVKID